MSKLLSLIVSAYNEAEGIEQFYLKTSEVCRSLSWDYEIIFVNDGSADGTEEKLAALAAGDEEHVRVLNFSRNFGHEAAMCAGLDYAVGDALVFMDADLQHPPGCLLEITAAFDEGYQVISMVRTANRSAGLAKNISSLAFYWLINRLAEVHFEPNASDFFAIDAQVQGVLQQSYREKVRFLRGFVQHVGFRKKVLRYEAAPRVAGSSKYSLRKLLSFSLNTIMSFSNMPLKLGIYSGGLSALLGLVILVYTLFTRKGAPSGYATIVVLLCFMFAMLFMLIGIIGEYISVLFAELKDRPIYIVREEKNIGGRERRQCGGGESQGSLNR